MLKKSFFLAFFISLSFVLLFHVVHNMSKESNENSRREYVLLVANSGGIQPGDMVSVNGISGYGVVTGCFIKDTKAAVSFLLDTSIVITDSAMIGIKNIGF